MQAYISVSTSPIAPDPTADNAGLNKGEEGPEVVDGRTLTIWANHRNCLYLYMPLKHTYIYILHTEFNILQYAYILFYIGVSILNLFVVLL